MTEPMSNTEIMQWLRERWEEVDARVIHNWIQVRDNNHSIVHTFNLPYDSLWRDVILAAKAYTDEHEEQIRQARQAVKWVASARSPLAFGRSIVDRLVQAHLSALLVGWREKETGQ